MKKIIFILIIFGLLTSCKTMDKKWSGNCEDYIKIKVLRAKERFERIPERNLESDNAREEYRNLLLRFYGLERI